MNKKLVTTCLVSFALFVVGCQSSGDSDDKTLASTHPKLEDQLKQDSVRTPISSDENPEIYQRYRITIEQAEAAGDYAMSEMYRGKLVPVDLDSHADARQYSTAIKQGLQEGVNFAGKYTVVTVGCGTTCQQHFIVNRETGKVLDKIQSNIGARFRPDSRLFVINPPDSTINYNECRYCTPETYVLEDEKLKKTEF